MSENDGIYVLKTPVRLGAVDQFEYRVAYATAIDNALDLDRAAQEEYLRLVFGSSFVFRSRLYAESVAKLMRADWLESGITTEYGVKVIEDDQPFPRTVPS